MITLKNKKQKHTVKHLEFSRSGKLGVVHHVLFHVYVMDWSMKDVSQVDRLIDKPDHPHPLLVRQHRTIHTYWQEGNPGEVHLREPCILVYSTIHAVTSCTVP